MALVVVVTEEVALPGQGHGLGHLVLRKWERQN
jgi:hypothetical protein